MSKINCFIPYSIPGDREEFLVELNSHALVNRIYLMGAGAPAAIPDGCLHLRTGGQYSTDTIKKIADHSTGVALTMLVTSETMISFGSLALERFVQVAEETGAGLVYSDYMDVEEGNLLSHPVIDYQPGSLRDDFEFGPVLMMSSECLIAAAE